jgi:hypothetical protein
MPGKHYVVLSAVGPHEAGELIEITDEHTSKGHDVERLIRLGTIREATAEDKKDHEGGKAREATPLGVSSDPDRTFRTVEPVQATPAGAQPQSPVVSRQAAEESSAGGKGSSSSSSSKGSTSSS